MPSHYGQKPEVEVESSMKPEKKEMPKRKSGMRKMSDKEKVLMKKHMELHMKDSSKSDKARARMKMMRSEKEVKSMKSLHKLLGM